MDWQKHRLIVMGVAALAMVGLTWWAIDTGTGDTEVSEDDAAATPTIPEVDRDEITELEIHIPADEDDDVEALTIRLVKGDDGWRLEEPVQAAASITAVNTALDKISDLEVTGRAASNDRFHERLEVAEANGIRVIARVDGETAIDVWIGAYQGGNTMVRQEGSDTVLTVRGSIKFAFNKRIRDWRNRTITELTANEVTEVEFTNENGHFTFTKNDDGWEQSIPDPVEGEDPVAPIEELDGGRVQTLVSGLARLRAASFGAPDVTAEDAGLGEGAAHVRLVSADGDDEVVTRLTVGNELDDGQRYVMIGGSDTIYVVSRFMSDRLLPNAESFQQAAESETPTPPPSGMPGMPGMPGGAGAGQIPPEIMQQIQQQLQAQGAGE